MWRNVANMHGQPVLPFLHGLLDVSFLHSDTLQMATGTESRKMFPSTFCPIRVVSKTCHLRLSPNFKDASEVWTFSGPKAKIVGTVSVRFSLSPHPGFSSSGFKLSKTLLHLSAYTSLTLGRLEPMAARRIKPNDKSISIFDHLQPKMLSINSSAPDTFQHRQHLANDRQRLASLLVFL